MKCVVWWRRLHRDVFLVLRVIAPGSVLVDVVDVDSAVVSRVIASPFFTRPRVLSGENTHTAQTALLFLYTLPPVAFTTLFISQDFGICFSAHSSSGLCFCVLAAQTFWALGDWCSAVALRLATTVLGTESR